MRNLKWRGIGTRDRTWPKPIGPIPEKDCLETEWGEMAWTED